MAILLNPTNVNIEINDDIGLMCISEEFSNHAPRETYLIQSQYEAARAFFQAERDDALGRWRDTENPDIIVYPRPALNDDDGRHIWLINELSGAAWLDWERGAPPGPARRYFETHPLPEPEPKPWENAKEGDYWVLTIGGETSLWYQGRHGLLWMEGKRSSKTALKGATAGHRIWPEGEASE